ncbi:MAG: DUF3429 domain-containing protein [Glaciecola sp.]
MHNSAKLLGYLGLLPFIGIPLLVLLDVLNEYQAYIYFVQYSAIILSFFGGIHWLDALQNRRNNHQLYIAMLPSIVGWLSLIVLEGPALFSALSVAYIGILMYDKYTLALEKDILLDYTTLRTILTTVVVASHLIMAYI